MSQEQRHCIGWKVVPRQWSADNAFEAGSERQYAPRGIHADAQNAARQAEWFDRWFPRNAPHRVMRVEFFEVARPATGWKP
jgi:hypothetical protein